MLTDAAIKRAKPRERQYKLSDSQGLYILVRPNGSRLWQMKYRFNGKEKTLSFGKYPEVSLAEARRLRDEARTEHRSGIDPSLTRRQKRAQAAGAKNLRDLFNGWLENNSPLWTPRHTTAVKNSIEQNILPSLGHLAAQDITPPMFLEVLRRIERDVSPDRAKRIRQRISAIYGYGIACGLVSFDPAAQLDGALKPSVQGRQPAITDLDELREMMGRIEALPSHPVVKLAFRFLALTGVRSNEVRGALWSEIQGDEWTIPPERMKMKKGHVVALSRQAIEVLDAVRRFSGRFDLVFPSPYRHNKPISDMTLSVLLKRNGYDGKHVPHGFRSSFSSIMNERRPEDRAIIDMMLAHAPKNKVEAAYNRAAYTEKRAEIAQEWADLLLDGLPKPHDIIQPSYSHEKQ